MVEEKIIVQDEKIKSLIYEVRGIQAMLDSDLAELYNCANGTKTINLAVKRNIERFPERFCFQLTQKEYNDLRFQFETSSLYLTHLQTVAILRFQIETLRLYFALFEWVET